MITDTSDSWIYTTTVSHKSSTSGDNGTKNLPDSSNSCNYVCNAFTTRLILIRNPKTGGYHMSESASNRQRKFVRLKGFDYSKNGAYFITICSKNKTSVFGRIHAGQMELNRYGKIALCAWHDLINSFPFIELDEFVVMPNHVHGIVIIQSVTDCNSIHDKCSPLWRMVGTFKSSVTRQINALRLTPGCGLWQRNYYEHIIRNELSLDRIREYIALNPIHWGKDPDNPDR